MARTIEAIRDEIIAEKANQSDLSTLNSSSATAIWRLWCWVVATVIHTHEVLWDAFKLEVDAIVAAAIPGTARWYREQCFTFQYGDDLTYIDERYQYATIDPAKQIIKRASVTEAGGIVFIKVAKLGSTAPEKLSNDEQTAFSNYISQIKFAGTQSNVISLDPDLIKITTTIYYDAKLINSSGQLISNTSIYPVADAVDNYLANLDFDGRLVISHLVDAMQKATGVLDVVITTVEAKTAAAASYSVVDRVYAPASGYFEVNELNITYNV